MDYIKQACKSDPFCLKLREVMNIELPKSYRFRTIMEEYDLYQGLASASGGHYSDHPYAWISSYADIDKIKIDYKNGITHPKELLYKNLIPNSIHLNATK